MTEKSSGPSQAWSFGLKLFPLGVGKSLLKTNRLNIYLKYLCTITFLTNLFNKSLLEYAYIPTASRTGTKV